MSETRGQLLARRVQLEQRLEKGWRWRHSDEFARASLNRQTHVEDEWIKLLREYERVDTALRGGDTR